MKIAIDFDDVIVEFTDSLMDYYHKKYHKKVTKDQILIWDWGLYWGIPREEAIKRVNEFHENYSIKELKPLENALDSLNELVKNHELIIITGRPIRFKHKVEEWLNYHLKKKLKIINAGEFHKSQAATKAEICKELDIQLLLEDTGETALDCAKNNIKVLLFDKPWNKQFKHSYIYRVNNWQEAISRIDYLLKG